MMLCHVCNMWVYVSGIADLVFLVLSDDHSRVRLGGGVGSKSSDYINASFIVSVITNTCVLCELYVVHMYNT